MVKSRRRNRPARPIVVAGLALAACLAGMAAVRGASAAEPQAPIIWYEAQTGLAIGGYDPVAYQVDRAPLEGRDRYELNWAGATWRFVSAANRAVFERDPDVYSPRFGGHDAYQLSRGYLAAGNPTIWDVEGDRLYLFMSADTQSRWKRTRRDERSAAESNWPALYLSTQ